MSSSFSKGISGGGAMNLQSLSMCTELVARMSKVRKEVSDLKSEALCSLMRPPEDETDHEIESDELRINAASKTNVTDILSVDRKQEQQHVALLSRLDGAERERQALLEFLQGDLGNTAVLARRLEVFEDELRVSKEAEAAATQRAKECENAMIQGRLMLENQDQQISSYQKTIDELQVDNELLMKEKTNLEQLVPTLRDEAYQLRNQLRTANEQLGYLQPRLQQTEPELQRLRKIQGEWQLEKSQLLEELGRLHPLANLLSDVETEFSSKSFSHVDEVPTVSSWSVGPELRRVSPRLYDYMRLLSQSIYRKESERAEAQDSRDKALREVDVMRIELDQRLAEARFALDSNTETLEQYSHRISIYENEFPAAQKAQAIVKQIRNTLSSFPGGLSGLFSAISFDVEVAHAATSATAKLVSSNTIAKDERLYGYGLEFEKNKRPMRGSSTGSHSKSDATSQPKPSSADFIFDEDLPTVIGKALAHNFNAVTGLREAKALLEQKESALSRLKSELHVVSRRAEARKEAVDELKASISDMASTRSMQESKLKANLVSAAELVENQNLFAIMLEAKLEQAKQNNLNLLKQVEVASREEHSMKNRLWKALKEGGHMPPSSESSTLELLDLAVSVLKSTAPLGGFTRTIGFSEGTNKLSKTTDGFASPTPSLSASLYGETSHFITSASSSGTKDRPDLSSKFTASLRDASRNQGQNFVQQSKRTAHSHLPDPSSALQDKLSEASRRLQSLRE